MSFIAGLLGLCWVLYYAAVSGHAAGFTGLLYVPALVLLAFGPLCVALLSFRAQDLLGAVRAVVGAMRYDARKSRAALFSELTTFSTHVRRGQRAEALSVADKAASPLLRQLAPLVLKQYSASALEGTSQTATFCVVSDLRRSEDVLLTLSRVAPAMGLVGTVLGLISLLKDLSRFEQLGPSMALALLCTLYGLVLANAVYQPLAKLVHARGARALEESKLVTRALVLLGEGKPLADIRNLFVAGAGEPVARDEAAEAAGGVALGGAP